MQESRDPTIPSNCIPAARDRTWPGVEILVEIVKPELVHLGEGDLHWIEASLQPLAHLSPTSHWPRLFFLLELLYSTFKGLTFIIVNCVCMCVLVCGNVSPSAGAIGGTSQLPSVGAGN